MSSYSNLYSHPSKKLETHLLNVANFSKYVIKKLNIINKKIYADLSFLTGICHDFAKSTSFFQAKLFDKIKTEKANHGFLSAVFAYYVITNYLKKNFNENPNFNFPTIIFIVILKHHGNLPNIDGANGEINKLNRNNKIALEQIKDLKRNLNTNKSLKHFYEKFDISLEDFLEKYGDILIDLEDNLEDLSYEEDINNYLLIIFFYSILLDADKMDASETKIFDRVELPQDMVDLFKKVNFGENYDGINRIREDAYIEVTNNIVKHSLNDKIYSIDLPTGAGKTLTAFSAVLKLRKKINEELGFTPRIIYSLPFLSIIDQSEKVFDEILTLSDKVGSNVMVKHTYFADMDYNVVGEENIGKDSARMLIEGWNSEIIITTFIQFFYSLISNKNRSLRKYHNMLNSIIILDEIQAIPYNYWEIVNLILKKLAHDFNSWVILMTATQPLIFSKNEIIPLVENKDYYYESFNRVNYNFNLKNTSLDEFKVNIINEIHNEVDKDFMFVLNTIDSSKELYDYIKNHFLESCEFVIDDYGVVCFDDKIDLIYLSTNIIPKHRLNRINHIKNSNKRCIIVTTQLIEAGVDISVDIVYRDFAPIDSIIQTAGRCNRNASGDKGLINVVSLVNKKGRRYSSFIYDSILLNATRAILKEKTLVSEKEFNMISSEDYYKYLKEYGSADDSRDLIKIIEQLYLKKIPEKFKLIDNDFEKIDIFVEIDGEASSVWNKYEEINDIENVFDKKTSFLEIKSKFYEYVISIAVKKLGSTTLKEEWLGFIDKTDISRKYDIETGFIVSEEEGAFII